MHISTLTPWGAVHLEMPDEMGTSEKVMLLAMLATVIEKKAEMDSQSEPESDTPVPHHIH